MVNIQKNKWKKGDTFALKIENSNFSKFNSKYIIIYNTDKESINDKNGMVVYLKICDEIPGDISKEFLDNLEFICTNLEWYENRFLPLEYNIKIEELVNERNKTTFFPDENGILYTYETLLSINEKNNTFFKNLIFLGNYELAEPKNEFKPWKAANISWFMEDDLIISNFITKVLTKYFNYNLKNSKMFEPEYAKNQRIIAQKAFEYAYKIEKERSKYLNNKINKKNR